MVSRGKVRSNWVGCGELGDEGVKERMKQR